ncbi:MAG: acetoacetate--CoA ligase [Saprospirales bacterium]|nr:MAG: acetoacetate--CoA ligase [Saprospirales bacterium]
MAKESRLAWEPDPELISNSNLTEYVQWLQQAGYLESPPKDYEDLWRWSVDNLQLFWKSIAVYYGLVDDWDSNEVKTNTAMPGTKWFQGLGVNYAEQMVKRGEGEQAAIVHMSENRPLSELSWPDLKQNVADLQQYLKQLGLKKGDRVVAYVANIPEATISFMACASLGIIWSSCSPDFGVESVLERFEQIEPSVLIATDGYSYNGKDHCRLEQVKKIASGLPNLKKVVLIPFFNGEKRRNDIFNSIWWTEIPTSKTELYFDKLPFDHPIWILYSSGTTGAPKAITHSHGGVLLEHLKYINLQNDVKRGERFFWFSTTGWMMWNFVHASFLGGATVVLYDGSPAIPDLNLMWKFIQDAHIHHFGTSAPFLVACMKNQLQPGKTFELSHLRTIGSTGSPLPPAAFEWIYQQVNEDVWLCSMSGGTDVCTAFVGSTPWKPVYIGEIQCRALGCCMEAFDEEGNPVYDQVGEMVILKPMPSMPVFFWNDKDNNRYKSSYFEHYPGVWRHGDWVKISSTGELVILGRSDATLNRQGVRIGTAEIYRAVDTIPEIKDSLIINLELPNGDHFMPLFVVMKENCQLTKEVVDNLKKTLRSTYSPRHVPDEVISVPDLPYTISGKKMEAPVKRILRGDDPAKVVNAGAMKNPESIGFFSDFAIRLKSKFIGQA